MALDGERILLLAADAVKTREVLRREPHRECRHAVAGEELGAGIESRSHREVVHVLHSSRDEHLVAAGRDAPCSLVDRLEARPAVAVDRHAADFYGEPGNERRLSRDIVSLLLRLPGAPPVHVFHEFRGNMRTGKKRLHGERG